MRRDDVGMASRRDFLRRTGTLVGTGLLVPLVAACASATAPATTPASSAPTPAPTAKTAAGPQATNAPSPATQSGSTAQSGTSGSPSTIRFATWTAAANLPAWKDAVAAFQQKYPTIKVNLEYTPGSQYWDKLSVEYAAGTAPDVIYSPPANAETVAAKGMVLDLSQFIKDDNFDLSNIHEASQRPFQWSGKVWGIACWNDTRYTIYNKTLFQKAGLPDLPQTWDGDFSLDQFLSYAQKLTDPNSQTWGYIFEDYSPAARWTWLFGAYYWDSLDYPTKAIMDSAEGIQGFQFIQDVIYKQKLAPSVAANLGGEDPMFQTGKVGMYWAGFKSAAVINASIKDFEWEISTIPKAKRRVSELSPQSFQITAKTKVGGPSWNLVKYCTDDEGNVMMTKATSMPANKKVDFNKVSPLKPWQNKLLLDALDTGLPDTPHPNIKPQFWTIVTDEMQQLMANTKTGADVAKSMASRINAAFQPYVVPR